MYLYKLYILLNYISIFIFCFSDCPLKLFSPVIAIANTLFNKTIGPTNRR